MDSFYASVVSTRIEPTGNPDIPWGHQLRRDYAWLNDYVELEKIKEKLKALNARRVGLRRLAPALEDFKTKLRESYAAYRARRLRRLANYLEKNLIANDPLGRFERLADSYLANHVDLDELLEAAEMLAPRLTETISNSDRGKELEAISKQIAKLEREALNLSPQEFFPLVNGLVVADIRAEFVSFWANKQRYCSEEVGPGGYHLNESSEPEQRAYYALEIAASRIPGKAVKKAARHD